jgi:small ligand-binding sensory domain FIST
MPAAASFSSAIADLRRVEMPLREVAKEVAKPSGGVIFVAGPLANELMKIGELVARVWPGVPTLIMTGAGVLNEREEHEGQGVSGVLFSGGSATVLTLAEGESGTVASALETARLAAAGDVVSAVLAVDPARVQQAIEAASLSLPGVTVIGGGFSTTPGVVTVSERGEIGTGGFGAMLISRVARPRVVHSPAFRLLGAPARVTAVHRGMALELDGSPALDELTRRARGIEDRPLVAALFLDGTEGTLGDPLRVGRVRPIRGVDPDKRAVAFVESVEVGQYLALGARDPAAARTHLNAVSRELSRESAGAAPRFALYFNCAGRGRVLYGVGSVDAGILRNQLGNVPIAGVMSALEITTPRGASPMLQYYTGVLGLFSSPS